MEAMEIGPLPVQTKVKIDLKGKEISRYQRKINITNEYLALMKRNPMSDAVIQQVKKRQVRVNGKWLTDFASCNYLGFDVHPEVMASVSDHVEELSTYPGGSRLLGSPYLYEKLEQEIVKLTGVPDCIIMPSLTLTHFFALPILAEEGDLFVDKRAHKTIYDGCMRASQYGATLVSFEHNNCEDLEKKLKLSTAKKKIICVDGVYSMHGYAADVPRMIELCEKYDAYLYVDDAHGFGVLGERAEDEASAFGKKGNGVIRYFGQNYDRVIYLASLSKSYSALLCFISCTPQTKDFLKVAMDPYLYSGPSPIPVLSCLLKSFEVNEREGDGFRTHLYQISTYFEKEIEKLGFKNENHTGFPVYRLTMENAEDVDLAGNFLYEQGIFVTLAPYPLVPRHEAGFRIQFTAANTQAEVENLLEVIKALDKKARIKRESDSESLKIQLDDLKLKNS